MKTHYYKDDILEICSDDHLTVAEIFRKLQERYPDVGKSSIYRNVEEMTKSGELSKICGIGTKALFEKNKGNHVHLIDQDTGEIKDLEHCDGVTIPCLPPDFEISNMDIKIFGKFSDKK